MSLFSELFTLTKHRRFAMLVSSDHASGLMTICIMPRALNEKDGPYCKDLTLTATPEDFDADFVTAINQYSAKIVPLLEQANEAAAAIEKTAQNAKSAVTAKQTGKSASKTTTSQPTPMSAISDSMSESAKAYREASDGDGEGVHEPNNDWMKNRQPELF